jgi:hypothetical protein
MVYDPRDPDAALTVIFKHLALENEEKSKAAGRSIFDDVEVCEIRAPGSRDTKFFPATEFSDWVAADPWTGTQPRKRSYAERFSRQYRQFKEQQTQTKSGTPLTHIPFLTEGQRATLRALNVYTAEQLAGVEGAELKNLGQGGRELKNKAEEFLTASTAAAPSLQLAAEVEALRAKLAVIEEDNEALKARSKGSDGEQSGNAMLDAMTDTQLKDYIASATGVRPIGNPARRTLLRSAMDAQQKATVCARSRSSTTSAQWSACMHRRRVLSPAPTPIAPCLRCWRSPTRWRSASPPTRATGTCCASR